MTGVPFLSKTAYKRIRGWTLRWNLPIQNFVECPSGFYMFNNKNEGLARFLEKDQSFLRKIFHFCTENCYLYGTPPIIYISNKVVKKFYHTVILLLYTL